MQDLHLGIFTFFAMAEAGILLLVLSVALLLRSRSLSARVRTLQGQLKKPVEATPPISFDQYLRDEVLRNQGLYEQAAASADGEQQRVAGLLAIRRQFFELELAARQYEKNPVQFLATLATGFGELVEQWRPEAKTVEVPITRETPADVVQEDGDDNDSSSEARRSTLDTHEQEFDRLKQVILNQQDAMSALRAELQAREADIDDLDSILQKLDEFEQHDAELQKCLKVLEQENQRLRTARADGSSGTKIRSMDPAQLNGLRSMIGNQQKTIGNLQKLIQELAPEASKAAELAAAISTIQRANEELNGCVAVLEDENAMLRAELDAVNAQLAHQEALAAGATTAEPGLAVIDAGDEDVDDGAPDPDEEKYQLEIKVQELEALVEFKDAAIEELERQYNKLESKYLALTGEK